MDLEKKTALITGAAAIGGIGHATAKLFAEHGATVIITGRDRAAGDEALAELFQAGADARFIFADLQRPDEVTRLAQEAGPVDVLINNAAAFDVGPTLGHDLDAYEASFATNVRAPYFLTANLVPGMRDRGAGSIVNVSTMAARLGMPGMSTYGAQKAALESLTRTWAAEFADFGVRVNAVAPGTTESAKVMTVMPGETAFLATQAPLKRNAHTNEIAEVVLFLASDRASFVTGVVLAADGGRTAV